jgi:hypothetical protein
MAVKHRNDGKFHIKNESYLDGKDGLDRSVIGHEQFASVVHLQIDATKRRVNRSFVQNSIRPRGTSLLLARVVDGRADVVLVRRGKLDLSFAEIFENSSRRLGRLQL